MRNYYVVAQYMDNTADMVHLDKERDHIETTQIKSKYSGFQVKEEDLSKVVKCICESLIVRQIEIIPAGE